MTGSRHNYNNSEEHAEQSKIKAKFDVSAVHVRLRMHARRIAPATPGVRGCPKSGDASSEGRERKIVRKPCMHKRCASEGLALFDVAVLTLNNNENQYLLVFGSASPSIHRI